MKLIIYINSVWASIISMFGCTVLTCGVVIAFIGADLVPGIIMVLIGVGLSELGEVISNKKSEKVWIKSVEKEEFSV